MSFEDVIEFSKQFLDRKIQHPKDDLSWDLHLKDRFEAPRYDEEKWMIWKVTTERELKSSEVGQTTLSTELDAKKAVGNFAWDLCGLRDVESISMVKSDDVFNVLTIITDLNLRTERKIAHAEVEILRKNPNLRFDFSVVPKRSRKLSDLTPTGSEVLYSRK